MTTKTITIASDHAGVALKAALVSFLEKNGYKVNDLGTNSDASVDYPDYAYALADVIKKSPETKGVLICGSGIGINIAANRFPFIRAAICYNADIAKLSRQHNDANVIVFGARFVSEENAKLWLETFLNTPFEGGRHQGRVQKLQSYNC